VHDEVQMPFGGVKGSGIGPIRRQGRDDADAIKTVAIKVAVEHSSPAGGTMEGKVKSKVFWRLWPRRAQARNPNALP